MKQGSLKKKLGLLLLAMAIAITALPQFSMGVHAEENTGDFIVSGGTYGKDYIFKDEFEGSLNILTDKKLTITTNGKVTKNRILSYYGGTTNLVFRDVYIDNSGSNTTQVEVNGTFNLTLEGDNKIICGGIGILTRRDFNIWAESTGKLTLIGILNDGLQNLGTVSVKGGTLWVRRVHNEANITTSGKGSFKPIELAPTVTREKKTANSITVREVASTAQRGEYSLDNKNWQDSNVFTGLKAGTSYTVYARYKETNDYGASEAGSVSVTTLKDGKDLFKTEPENLEGRYGQKLSDVELPEGWKWKDGDTSLTVGEQKYSAFFETREYEDAYDFSEVEGYNSTNQRVGRSLTVQVQKAESSLSIASDMNQVYDGEAVANPQVTKTGSTNEVTLTWYQKQDNGNWNELDAAPVDAGNYKVAAKVEADDNYREASAEKEFEISRAENTWKEELSIADWTYDEKECAPKATAVFGKVAFSYRGSEHGTYTEEIPKNAGTWYVKATVAGNANYTGLESVKAFTIHKAASSVRFTDDLNLDKSYDTETVAIKEKDIIKTGSTGAIQFSYEEWDDGDWKTLTEAPSKVGKYRVIATLVEDTNYLSATSKYLEFSITKAIPTYEVPTGLSMKQGDTLSSVELPKHFTWKDAEQVADTYGKQVFTATFTPEDTANYQSVEVDITVDVLPLLVSVNHAPIIMTENEELTLTVGDVFDDTIALQGVTASDAEDGDLTKDLKVIKNTVDTEKVGTYKVVYEVTDSQGASATKTIKVIVKEKEVKPADTAKPNKPSDNKSDTNMQNKDNGSVKTSDQANVGLFTILLIMSALCIVAVAVWKKRALFLYIDEM